MCSTWATYSGTLLLSTTDAAQNTTTYTYTTAADSPQRPNLLKAVTDPLGHTTRYAYNSLGQRTVMTDAAGIVTTFGYDNLGRLTTTTLGVGTLLQ